MRRIVRIFLAGLLALLPLTATIAVTIWLVRFAVEYIGPESMVGGVLTSIGLSIEVSTPPTMLFGPMYSTANRTSQMVTAMVAVNGSNASSPARKMRTIRLMLCYSAT